MLGKCFDNKIQPFSNNIIVILKNVSKKCSNECSNDSRKILQINVIKMLLQKGFLVEEKHFLDGQKNIFLQCGWLVLGLIHMLVV